MANPLTKEQERLHGKNVRDMNFDELQIWIHACERMEIWVKFNKARRSWKESREAAIEELDRRRNYR